MPASAPRRSTPRLRSALLRLRSVSPRLVVVFSAVALIPLIYAGLLTTANLDPTHRLDSVPAAIVNEDTGATAADGSALALGDALTEELTSSTSTSNFDWTPTDADEAARELASGAVSAVLTVPAGFSADVASVGGDDPLAATAATLSIETNDGANLIVGNIAATIGSTVTQTLEKQVGESYLKNVYVGFTDVHDSLELAADGATQLADGASTAADGSNRLVVGLDRLRDGTAELSTGAASLRSGADSAADGAATLSTGLQRLADETAALPSSAAALDSGAQSVAAGAETLDGGAAGLATGAATLATGTAALDAGAASAAAGAQSLTVGASSAADGTATALGAATRLADGSAALAASTPALASGAATVDTGLQALIAQYPTLSDTQRLALLTELQAGSAQVAAGATAADQGAQSLAAGSSALVGDSSGGLTALAAGTAAVATGAADLTTGTKSLASGAASADAGAQSLATGAQSLAAGAATLDSGRRRSRPAPAPSPAASARSPTASAARPPGRARSPPGTASLAAGSGALAGGAADAAQGSADAATGAGSLDSGIDSLATGSETLSGNLADGAADVPSYTDDEADSLSAVAAAPVSLDTERLNRVSGYGSGLAPYFLGLALWVGALAFYLMSAPLSERLLAARRPAWRIALRSYLPGAVMAVAQGVLAALMLRFGVGVDMAHFPALVGIAVLTSLTFVAINQALIALLDAPGRFLALLLMVVQLSSAGGTYPIETAPAFFQIVHGVLPLTYSVEAFRSLIAGGGIGVANAVLVLSLWLLGALAVTVLAAARRRRGLAPALRDPEPLLETA
ncbi:YhgE/Pip domain-containing protein [Rathayibacter sp. VKM Ac-2760]|uniref:YhgE/Pip domain-containing protein n=1 Tax=Rathayibacter sp. VKM Ac-2760 TaxID=2609253 RepID=UPI001317E212|nr:YhgE/Pip domain-containing protein [Rathayibacter sp. VKM Ac-2760]QHC57653.1 ABC transporter permease [Rathayibacter sp. VKM Ac-2760]